MAHGKHYNSIIGPELDENGRPIRPYIGPPSISRPESRDYRHYFEGLDTLKDSDYDNNDDIDNGSRYLEHFFERDEQAYSKTPIHEYFNYHVKDTTASSSTVHLSHHTLHIMLTFPRHACLLPLRPRSTSLPEHWPRISPPYQTPRLCR